jgi:hypothetical protein
MAVFELLSSSRVPRLLRPFFIPAKAGIHAALSGPERLGRHRRGAPPTLLDRDGLRAKRRFRTRRQRHRMPLSSQQSRSDFRLPRPLGERKRPRMHVGIARSMVIKRIAAQRAANAKTSWFGDFSINHQVSCQQLPLKGLKFITHIITKPFLGYPTDFRSGTLIFYQSSGRLHPLLSASSHPAPFSHAPRLRDVSNMDRQSPQCRVQSSPKGIRCCNPAPPHLRPSMNLPRPFDRVLELRDREVGAPAHV